MFDTTLQLTCNFNTTLIFDMLRPSVTKSTHFHQGKAILVTYHK
jgi:hypothetical protein